MASSGWVRFGGRTLIDMCATTAALDAGVRPRRAVFNGCACTCGDRDPETPAPWDDGSQPASEFAGLMPLTIDGLESAPFTRETVAAGQAGSVLRPGRLGHREVLITGLLIGSTCAGINYGMEWLKSVLKGSCDGGGCVGDDLEYLTCAPCDEDPEASQARTLHRAGLLSGPIITELATGTGTGVCGDSCSGTCSSVWEVELIIVTGDPYAYADPVTVADSVILDTCDPGDACNNILWHSEGSAECVADADCLDTVACIPTLTLPHTPTAPSGCAPCEPLNVTETCHQLDTDENNSADTALRFTFDAGAEGAHNIIVRLYQTSGPDPDTEGLTARDAVAGFAVSEIPPDGSLIVDTELRAVTLDCPTAASTEASALVTGLGDTPFTFPVVPCGDPTWWVCVTVDCDQTTAPVEVTIETIERER